MYGDSGPGLDHSATSEFCPLLGALDRMAGSLNWLIHGDRR